MFGFGFTKKLKSKIVDLEKQVSEDAKRIDNISTYNKSQIAIREGENIILKARLSNAEAAVETWKDKSVNDQTKIDVFMKANNSLKGEIQIRDKAIENFQNERTQLNKTILLLENKVVELRNPKTKAKDAFVTLSSQDIEGEFKITAPSGKVIFNSEKSVPPGKSAKLKAYYDRGKK
jgi:chromosome segregation ATPase